MSQKRQIRKTYHVTCPREDCPQPDDAFLVSYEVEEDEQGVLTIRRKAAIEFSPQLPVERGWDYIERPCPWCGHTSTFKVPLGLAT